MSVTIGEFLERLEASGVLDEVALEAVRAKANETPNVDADAEPFVKQLHRDGAVTGYQAKALWKNKGSELSLGNYVVEDELGRGGMGVVLKARHRRMKRQVAIKVLPPNMVKDADAIARFQREVEAAAQLLHPNIVSAFDADEFDGRYVLVMEFVDGRDLSSVVKKGPLSVEQAIDCVLQAARGLEFAHSKGVVHRDIKPANLLLDSSGTVKILDMGLARFSDTSDVGTQAELTGTGTIMGTVDYMSPEQALSTRSADERADVYSLGCTLHYLLTAKPTYGGDTLMARMLAHERSPIPDLRNVRPYVPEPLQAVFERMVAKSVDDRFQTMSEVVAALEECRTNASGTVVTAHARGSSDSAVSAGNLSGFLKSLDTDVSNTVSPSRTGAMTAATPEVDVDSQTVVATPTSGTVRTQSDRASTPPIVHGLPTWLKDWRVLGGAVGLLALVLLIAMSIGGNDRERGDVVDDDTPPTIDDVGAPPGSFALKFDGVDDCVDLSPFRLEGEGRYTIEAIVYCNGPHDQTQKFLATVGDPQFAITDSAFSGLRFVEDLGKDETGESHVRHVTTSRPVAGKWVHVACVWDGERVHGFVDGRHLDGEPVESSFRGQGGADRVSAIGVEATLDRHFFRGRMSEVRISSTARYVDDFIPPHFEISFEPDEYTLALYHFDEGQGDVLKDSSGNGHHGKIVGAKWVRIREAPSPPPKKRYALEFDGKDDVVVIDSLRYGGGPFTVEAWVDPEEGVNNEAVVLEFQGDRHRAKLQFDQSGLLRFGRAAGESMCIAPVSAQGLLHFAGTWDGERVSVYLNGKRAAESSEQTGGFSFFKERQTAFGGPTGPGAPLGGPLRRCS